MKHVLWQAKLSDDEWGRLTANTFQEICDRLDAVFDNLRQEYLNKGVTNYEG